jgi:hypothetical protein
MTASQTITPQAPRPPASPLPANHQVDAVLEELWAVKREINAQARFDVKEIARLANAQSLDGLLRKKSH